MQITPLIKSILLSISGRSRKYGKFGLSRHEYKKYDTTPDKLRLIIKKLKSEGYITLEGYEPNPSFKANPVRALYKATQKLLSLVQSFSESISEMSEKIVKWCSENPIQKLRDYGVEVFSGGRIGKKKSSLTIGKKGAMKDWKTGKTYNIFNYLREKSGMSVKEFFINNIG